MTDFRETLKNKIQASRRPRGQTLRVNPPSQMTGLSEEASQHLNDLMNLVHDDVPPVVSRKTTPEEKQALSSGKSPSSLYSEKDRAILMQLGWKEGEVVPPAFAKEFERILDNYAKEQQEQRKPLSEINIRDYEELPDEVKQQASEALKSFQESFSQGGVSTTPLSAYPASLKNVISSVDLRPLSATYPDDEKEEPAKQESIEKPVPEVQILPSESSKEGSKLCQTCGNDPTEAGHQLICLHCFNNPLENPQDQPIDKNDAVHYINAIGSNQPFTKDYQLFGETIRVRFRNLSIREMEEVEREAVKRTKDDGILDWTQAFTDRVVLYSSRYFLFLQIVELTSSTQVLWQSPRVSYPCWSDWAEELDIHSLSELEQAFVSQVSSDGLMTALAQARVRFNLLEMRLGREAFSRDFFKTT
jgi:ribosomal protein L20A (L18A)